jgi:hypothetical protein
MMLWRELVAENLSHVVELDFVPVLSFERRIIPYLASVSARAVWHLIDLPILPIGLFRALVCML